MAVANDHPVALTNNDKNNNLTSKTQHTRSITKMIRLCYLCVFFGLSETHCKQ